VPAWRASRVEAQATLKESGARGTSSGIARHRFLQGAVVAQLALTVVLLLGAGVMLRSLAQLLAVDPGFRPAQVTSLQITPGGTRYASNAARVAMYDQLLQRVDALPGVEAAGLTTTLPFSDMIQDSSPFQIVGDAAPIPEGETRHANITVVGGDYFQALGIPLLRGRLFTSADDRDAPHVVIIDEELANRYFPNEDPVGRQIGTAEQPVTIVGVVGSIRQRELTGGLKATRFYPYHQMPWYPWAGLTVRGSLEPTALAATVRSAIRDVDPELPVFDLAPMQQRVERSVGAQRMAVTVLAGFAALALTLAVLGTYGVLSYSTSQRTHELGIRMALGAQPGDVLQMVLRNGIALAGSGLIVGIAAYFAIARLIESMVFGVSARDPMAMAIGLSTLLVAALIATWIPARRAARVDPVVALREE
jgi:putative ABC transport system permease protein